MSESQGGAGRREVAWRLFAAEFDDADYSYSQSDEERAPNYVVTPTGARVNRLFVVGVLTEIETVSEDYLRARVVDPTGPFVVYAGQYQPDALAFLERAEPPTFVAVTGKARTYQPDDSDQVFTSVRPESISEVEGETRDRWVVQTAEQTVDRVARMAEAKQSGLAGDELRTALEAHGVEEGLAAGIPLALDHYGTTGDYLAAVREMALDSARVVADEIDEAESLTATPDQGGDDPVSDLVERPIDLDSLATGGAEVDDGTVEDDAATADSDENVAAAGAGDGSAIGTAESSNQADSPSESESVETTTSEPADGAAGESADEAVDESADESVAGSPDEPDPDSAAEPADEPADTAPETGDTSTGGDEVTAEPADASTDDGPATDSTTDATDATANPDSPSSGEDDLEDFEPEFDLDEDEREELEEEFGTEFQSGTEVSEPGEAGIETPDPDDVEGDATETEDVDEQAEGTSEATGAEPTTEIDSVDETEPAPDATTGDEEVEAEAAEDEEAGEEPAASEAAEDVDLEDVDLEDAVMDAMADLDEGDGAQRDDVLAAVVDRTGADPGDVEDAIQDALMGGRCYEPDDETLKPI